MYHHGLMQVVTGLLLEQRQYMHSGAVQVHLLLYQRLQKLVMNVNGLSEVRDERKLHDERL